MPAPWTMSTWIWWTQIRGSKSKNYFLPWHQLPEQWATGLDKHNLRLKQQNFSPWCQLPEQWVTAPDWQWSSGPRWWAGRFRLWQSPAHLLWTAECGRWWWHSVTLGCPIAAAGCLQGTRSRLWLAENSSALKIIQIKRYMVCMHVLQILSAVWIIWEKSNGDNNNK